MYVRCKITRADGSNLVHEDVLNQAGDIVTRKDVVAPVNNFLHALFNQVDVSLNDKLISSSAGSYAYRAYIET
ncbi:hypothetical protein KQ786_15240, partial [Listeria monocytogenes]|nr:hypothetical protein [Listeria monocytogenes]